MNEIARCEPQPVRSVLSLSDGRHRQRRGQHSRFRHLRLWPVHAY